MDGKPNGDAVFYERVDARIPTQFAQLAIRAVRSMTDFGGIIAALMDQPEIAKWRFMLKHGNYWNPGSEIYLRVTDWLGRINVQFRSKVQCSSQPNEWVLECLCRFVYRDYGDVSAGTASLNLRCLNRGDGAMIGAYSRERLVTPDDRIYVVFLLAGGRVTSMQVVQEDMMPISIVARLLRDSAASIGETRELISTARDHLTTLKLAKPSLQSEPMLGEPLPDKDSWPLSFADDVAADISDRLIDVADTLDRLELDAKSDDWLRKLRLEFDR